MNTRRVILKFSMMIHFRNEIIEIPEKPCVFLRRAKWAFLLSMLATAGCATDEPINPSFSITIPQARQVLRFDIKHPHRLQRPLLIVGGFMDPGFAVNALSKEYHWWTGDDRIVSIQLGLATNFDDCRRDIIKAVDDAFPSRNPSATTEVDVIGVSMGGLAARYAAAKEPRPGVHPTRRLNIARLFTISSPNRGALLADEIPLDLHPLQQDMRSTSGLIDWLNTRCPDAEEMFAIYSYTRLNDLYVGTYNAAVPGRTAWWVAPPPLDSPHGGAFHDARILADILCRLRSETPLTKEPPSPLPTSANAKSCTR